MLRDSSVLNTHSRKSICFGARVFFSFVRCVLVVVANLSRAHGGDGGGGCLMRDSLDHNRFSVVDAMTTRRVPSHKATRRIVFTLHICAIVEDGKEKNNNNTTFEN